MAKTSRAAREPRSKGVMVATKQLNQDQDGETLAQAFWRGFFWPSRALWRGLAWLSHHFPLKHIGHALRWFFRLRPVRFIGRVLGLKYVRDSWKELRQVTWPTFRESRRLTTAVIIFSVLFGLIIALVDFGLDKLFKQFILK